ncbi:hypothetical protein Q8A73_016131 [Channa argus]|nr:hypothetical protein Q8A73_016131 [Channa argus]
MISASGSNPLERCSKCTLILQVIQLMNDPGTEALTDPTLIMLREPHLGGTVGRLANTGTMTQEKPYKHSQLSAPVEQRGVVPGRPQYCNLNYSEHDNSPGGCTCQNLPTMAVHLSSSRQAQTVAEFRMRSFHIRRPKSQAGTAVPEL